MNNSQGKFNFNIKRKSMPFLLKFNPLGLSLRLSRMKMQEWTNKTMD